MPHFIKKNIQELNRLSSEQALEAETQPLVLVLDNIRSRANVGAIFRSADAFGVELIVLLGITPTPPHRDIHKSALGAEDAVRWVSAADWQEAKTQLEGDYVLAALEQTHDSTALANYRPSAKRHVVVVGNEVSGVSEEILAEADCSLEIQQRGHKHSLNVATSTGIVLYHLTRVHPIVDHEA